MPTTFTTASCRRLLPSPSPRSVDLRLWLVLLTSLVRSLRAITSSDNFVPSLRAIASCHRFMPSLHVKASCAVKLTNTIASRRHVARHLVSQRHEYLVLAIISCRQLAPLHPHVIGHRIVSSPALRHCLVPTPCDDVLCRQHQQPTAIVPMVFHGCAIVSIKGNPENK